MGSKSISKNEAKNICIKNRPKSKKVATGGGVRWNARAGGEDPRRGIRSDQGQNLSKSSGQETRAGQELEELAERIQHAVPLARQGAADRFAHSAGPNQ